MHPYEDLNLKLYDSANRIMALYLISAIGICFLFVENQLWYNLVIKIQTFYHFNFAFSNSTTTTFFFFQGWVYYLLQHSKRECHSRESNSGFQDHSLTKWPFFYCGNMTIFVSKDKTPQGIEPWKNSSVDCRNSTMRRGLLIDILVEI